MPFNRKMSTDIPRFINKFDVLNYIQMGWGVYIDNTLFWDKAALMDSDSFEVVSINNTSNNTLYLQKVKRNKMKKYSLWKKVGKTSTEFGLGTKWMIISTDPLDILDYIFSKELENTTMMLQYEIPDSIIQCIEIRNSTDQVEQLRQLLDSHFIKR